jgi:hypothetical protein
LQRPRRSANSEYFLETGGLFLRLTYRSVDSKADQLRGMDKLIGAMKSIGENVGSLIEMRKLAHETLQETEWKLWNYKRYVAGLDIT